MERILSEEEIDALLKAAQDIKSQAGEAGASRLRTGEAMPYDLTSQGQPVRGPLPALDRVDDRFARAIGPSLVGVLRRRIDGAPRGRAFLKLDQLLASLPTPSCLALFRVDALGSAGLVILDASLVYAVLDAFFGAKEVADDGAELRELTAIEQRIVARVVRVLLDDLAKAWEPVLPMRPDLVRVEMNPAFVNHLPAHAVVIDTEVSLDIDGKQATVRIVLPYAALEPHKEKLASGLAAAEQGARARGRMWSSVRGAQVQVAAELGRASMPVRGLLALRVGDVLTLDGESGGGAVLRVQGTTKAVGQPVVSRGSYALRLERLVSERRSDKR